MNKTLYKQEIEKQAALASTIGAIASKALPTVAKGVKSFASMSTPKRALMGAGANAALKGITYKPQQGENNIKGRLGAMASGAITGGIAGSLASKSKISDLGSKVSDVGQKVFDSANSGKVSDIVGNIGTNINTAGNKIKDYFNN